MRRVQLGLVGGSFAAILCVVLASGCGGVVDHESDPIVRKDRGGSSKIVVQTEKLTPVKGDYKGVIKGSVKWTGEEPNGSMTDRLRETISKHNDSKVCLNCSEVEKTQQVYRIGKNKGLGNVFVWIAPEPKHAFDVPDDQLPKNKEVMISQPHCAFLPHCAAVFATRYKDGAEVPTGQLLIVQNDATIAHNAALKGGPRVGERNELLGAWSGEGPTKKATFELKPERNAIRVSCGIHGWMSAYVWAYDHPYFAVSSVGADHSNARKPVWENLDSDAFGTFEIKGAPIGAKVRVYAWHEELGFLPGYNGKEMTLDADAKKNELNIEAKAK
jgi:hypothetical protein